MIPYFDQLLIPVLTSEFLTSGPIVVDNPSLTTMPRHKLPAWRRYLTVEPALFFYAYGFMTGYPLYRQYVYSVFSEQKGFPYREVAKADEGLGCQGNDMAQNSTLRELEREVR